MASSEEHFDSEKARREIFSSRSCDILFTINFVISAGKKLVQRRRFQDAKKLLNASIERVRGITPLVCLLVLFIGRSFREAFQYDDALNYFLDLQKFTSNAEGKVGESLQAATFHEIGIVYFSIRKFDNAIDYLQKALRIALKHKDRYVEMSCYGDLGNNYKEINKTKLAIEYFEKALGISIELGDRNREGLCYANLGPVYHHLGQLQKSLEYTEKSLSINQELGDRLNQLKDHRDLSALYLDMGEYQRAIDYGKQCLALSTELGAWDELGCSYTNLGLAYYYIGQYEKAIGFHEKALSVSKSIRNRAGEGKDYGNLGQAYMWLGRYEKAIEYFEKGLAVNIEVKDRSGEGVKYAALASAYEQLGQVKKAYFYARKALNVSLEVGDQIQLGIRYSKLGMIFLRMGRFEEAISYCEKGREISSQTGDIHGTITSELDLGNCSLRMAISETDKERAGQLLNNARTYFTKALRTIDGTFSELVADKDKMSFVNEYFSAHVQLMHTLLMLERPEAALLAVDVGKAKALQCLVDQQQNRNNQVTRDNAFRELTWTSIETGKEKTRLNDIFHSIQQKQNQASVLVYSFDLFGSLHIWVLHEGSEGPECTTVSSNLKRTTFVDVLDGLFPGVYRKLRRDFSYFSTQPCSENNLIQVGNVNVIAPKIFPSLTCSAESGLSNSFSALCLEKSSMKQTTTSDQSHSNNDRSVISCYDLAVDISRSPKPASKKASEQNVTMPIADENDSKKLKTLHKNLIDPVKYSIKGRKLIIVPDDKLFFVPFCSLLDENGRPLSETYSIQMTPSMHTLASSIQVPHTSKLGPALFVGNPSVGKVHFEGQSVELELLPCAKEEVISLAKHFEAKPLVEKEATKGRVLERLPDASVIHIAAHGERGCGEVFLAPDTLSETTGDLPRKRNYLLRQEDVIDLQLNARLVVLSCCHTGHGLVSPEGVVGLARSFLGAGARSVLVALWPIPDNDTKVFMEFFYSEICKQTGVCEALKLAQNTFQKSTNEQRRSFRTWAPFTMYGEDVSFTKEDIIEIRKRSRESSN